MRRIAVLSVIWGFSFLFIKLAVEDVTPATVAFGRVTLGAAVVVASLRARGIGIPTDAATWRHFVVTALFGSAIPFTALAWGEERITSALTSVLNASTPLFTAAVAVPLTRERFRPVQVAGLAAGFFGVAVAAGLGRDDLAGSAIAGSLAALGAGLCYGIGYVYVKRNLSHLRPGPAVAGQLLVSAVLLAPVAVWTTTVDGATPTWGGMASLAVLGLVGTGGALLIHYSVVLDLGPTTASLVTYLVPVVAVLAGTVFLDEALSPRLIFGGLIVVAGVAATSGTLKLPRRPAPPATVAALVIVMALVTAACGGGDDESADGSTTTSTTTTTTLQQGNCTELADPVDEASFNHVLPGSPEPTYLTEPPSSGPHDPRPVDGAVLTEPISRPRQVGQLEAGSVLIQHNGLSDADRQAVEALAGQGVIVAPNPDLPTPVVATAWSRRLQCPTLDVDSLVDFANSWVDAVGAEH